MFHKLKKMKPIYKIMIILGILVSCFCIFNQTKQNYNDELKLFSDEDLEVLEIFRGEKLSVGLSLGSEVSFQYALKQLLWDELMIELVFQNYKSYEEAELATINGEVDVLINTKDMKKSTELLWTSQPVTNTQFVITNDSRFLKDEIDLKGKSVGFLRNSVTKTDFESLIGTNYFESFYFDSVLEALQAVERHEISAFITRREHVQYDLIAYENAEVEFMFQNKILTLSLGTSREDVSVVLNIINDLMESPRRELFMEKLETIENLYLESLIREYIQKKYGDIIEKYEKISVGMHDSSFPFSFFNEEGEPEGIYIEILELFYNSTDIPYYIKNIENETNLNQLIHELKLNEIQLVLGVSNEFLIENIIRIDEIEIQDNLISIGKVGLNLEKNTLYNLKFGVISDDEVAKDILGIAPFVKFNTYKDAFGALYREDVDLIIGRESVLSYYRDMVGMSLLTQTSHINRISSHSILGNEESEGLNEMMGEIKRLYNLLYFGNQNMRWTNRINSYQNRYIELRRRWSFLIYMLISSVSLGSITIFLIKERDNRKLKDVNSRDPLTHLYNKRAYKKKCMELINRHSNELGLFLFIDLNDFKKVNDIYGHQVGDLLLIEFAKFLQEFTDTLPHAICFRISGDEFGLFTIGYKNREEIEKLIRKIPENMTGYYIDEIKRTIKIDYCAGGSVYNLDTVDFKNLKNFADLAMYEAKKDKKNGRTNMNLFDIQLLYNHQKEALISQLIHKILETKDIYPVYQPIYSLDKEGVFGYEGLSRTNNPEIKNIMMLIELAEKANRVQELDLLMMEKVLLGFKGEGKLFVNMTGLTNEFIKEYFQKLILVAQEKRIPLENIVIELSERTKWSIGSIALIKDYREKYKFLIAIDDFGMGFSDDELVLKVKPDIVKIDKSFVQNIHKNKHKYYLLKAYIIMLKENQIEIACEGIEEKEELEILKILGSDYGQGYYLGRPE